MPLHARLNNVSGVSARAQQALHQWLAWGVGVGHVWHVMCGTSFCQSVSMSSSLGVTAPIRCPGGLVAGSWGIHISAWLAQPATYSVVMLRLLHVCRMMQLEGVG